MQTTPNYSLLIAEGTDLVNYLTQTNPNFSNLDTIIKGVSDLTITPATEVTSGTAHAISRTLSDCNVIRFVATSNWVTGDTMTIDGTTVSPLKTDGTALKSGDYIIGATVIGVLDSTRFTVFVSSAAPVNASDIVYDNTGSGLSANNVEDAVDEVYSSLIKIRTIQASFNGGKTARIGTLANDDILSAQLLGNALLFNPTVSGGVRNGYVFTALTSSATLDTGLTGDYDITLYIKP